MTRDVYLVRHGQTRLNAAGLLRGHLDSPLDAVGQAQARDLATQLGGLGLSRIVSSPLRRATETAGPIAAAAGIMVDVDARFIDRDYGVFNGRAPSEATPQFSVLADASGVEPAADVATRAGAGLTELVADTEPGPLAIVTHDAVIQLLIRHVVPATEHHAAVLPLTGSWTLLRFNGSGWNLVAVVAENGPVHLERP